MQQRLGLISTDLDAVEIGSRVPGAYRSPELAVVVPTLNELDNIEPLLEKLKTVLAGLSWEVVFVDDDSRDGTVDLLNQLQSESSNVRVLRRVGRRGLSSACVEGMLATSAPFLAVMDADLQHDETVLPRMLEVMKSQDVDVVVGTRFASGGSAGGFSRLRFLISRVGSWLSRSVCRAQLSDPMSGFFMLRRGFFEQTVRRMSGQGFKILLDLFASAPRPVRFVEIPYHFRQRYHGASKLDTLVMLEYMTLIGDKLFGHYVPVRFLLFVLVGVLGLLVHLGLLGLFFRTFAFDFYYAQEIATLIAMTVNLI